MLIFVNSVLILFILQYFVNFVHIIHFGHILSILSILSNFSTYLAHIDWTKLSILFFREAQLRVPLTVLQWFPQKLGVLASPLERVLWSTIWQTPMQFHLLQWQAPAPQETIHAQPQLQSISQVIISFLTEDSRAIILALPSIYEKQITNFLLNKRKNQKKYLCSKLAK